MTLMIWPILALGFLLRIIALNQSFWLDETAQAVLSRTPIFNVNYAADFQPPLFYVFSHFWMQCGALFGLGQTEWFLRLPSVFFGLATVYFTYVLGKKLFSEKTGLLAAFFLTIAPFHVYYSQEFRMYSLLTLLCLLCWNEIVNRRWMMLSFFVALSVFTHYFAFINIVSMGIFLWLTHQKRGLGYLLAGLLPFALWIPTLSAQLKTADHLVSLWPKWSEVSNAGFLKFIPLLAAKMTVGMIRPTNRDVYAIAVGLFSLISGSMTMLFLREMLSKKKQGTNFYALVHYGLISILIAWLGGLWLPAATPTRIQFVLPALYLIIAASCIHALAHKKLRTLTYIVIGVFCAVQLFFTADYLYSEKHHREDWRGAIAYSDSYILSHQPETTMIVTAFDNKWAPMDWYSIYPEKYMGGTQYAEPLDDHVILYTYLFEIFDAQKNVEKKLLEQYSLTEEKDFRGVGILKTFTKK